MTKDKEIITLFKYLTGQSPSERMVSLYSNGIKDLQLELTPKEQSILEWCIKYPGGIRVADNGLALFMKNGNLRNRLLLATAIIECHPIYRDRFLNNAPVKYAGLKFILAITQSACLIGLAIVLFKWKRWK